MSKFLKLYVEKCWWSVILFVVLLLFGFGIILSALLTLAISALYLSADDDSPDEGGGD